LNECEKLTGSEYFSVETSLAEQAVLVQDTDEVEDFNHNSSSLAAGFTLSLVTVGCLTLLHLKPCLGSKKINESCKQIN
jgi:hypothetical protein